MRSSIIGAIAGAALSNALVIRTGCSLHLSVAGSMTGPVGQISSGQARVGNGISSATFTLGNGGLTDSMGRGCFWTPPTKTLQCDKGQAPVGGFHIGCHGRVDYNGQHEFWECDASGGQYNLYLEPNGVNCRKVTIMADGCHAECPPPYKPPPPSNSCPANLNGPYEFPHLIVPVNSAQPNTAYGTQYNGEVTSTISTIFNFDIPGGDAGKKCTLVFLFPLQKDLQTSSFTFSGDGVVDFLQLSSPATQGTTYANQPGVSRDWGTATLAPGHSYTVGTFDCPAGQRIAFEVKAAGSKNTNFEYFQDYNPSPIGLYITKC